MSEETTHNLPDKRSFEDRVFARFDALDAGMARMESRLDNVETRLERLEARACKPWKPSHLRRGLSPETCTTKENYGLERNIRYS